MKIQTLICRLDGTQELAETVVPDNWALPTSAPVEADVQKPAEESAGNSPGQSPGPFFALDSVLPGM